jgi:hypothetical protein
MQIQLHPIRSRVPVAWRWRLEEVGLLAPGGAPSSAPRPSASPSQSSSAPTSSGRHSSSSARAPPADLLWPAFQLLRPGLLRPALLRPSSSGRRRSSASQRRHELTRTGWLFYFLFKDPIAFFFSVEGPLCICFDKTISQLTQATKQHFSPTCFSKLRLPNIGKNLN